MRYVTIILFLGLFALPALAQEFPVSGQNHPVLKQDYSARFLDDFLEQAANREGIRFYYPAQGLDSVEVDPVKSGTSLAGYLTRSLEGTEFRFFIDKGNVFLFRGAPLLHEVADFEMIRQAESEERSDKAPSSEEGNFIETNQVSQERFLTVGSQQYSNNRSRYAVTGSITNGETDEPMIGATVYVQETEVGTSTDVNGNFQLRLPAGRYHISVDHMAMKSVEYGLNVLSDGHIDIALENELIQIEEVTLVNKRESNVEGMLMGFERISTRSVKEVPVVMGEKDVIKIAQMLPGVQNAGEGSSGFNVRGGSADQNMFYINNISVYNTSHLFGFFTAFSPDIISDFSLYKNNVPAKYGGRIASIFEITTRQGNKENFFAQGGVSPITGHFAVEGPVIKNKVSFVGSFRSTYSDWILNRVDDYDLQNSNASFNDGTFGINADLNEKNQVKAFFYRSSDDFSLSYRNDYSYSNMGGSVNWKHSFSDALTGDFSLATSNYNFSTIDKNNITEAYQHDYFIRHTEARADFLALQLENHRVEFGINGILYDLDRGDILPHGSESRRSPIALGMEQAMESAVYVSDEFSVLPKLDILLGLRYSFYAQLGAAEVREYYPGLPRNKYNFSDIVNYGPGEVVKTYSGLEPRAALNYKISPVTSVKASYNRLQQYIFLLSNTIAIAPNDQWKLADYHITPPVSDQVSVGFYHDFYDEGINLSAEVYRKWVGNVVEYKDGADFISPEPLETQILQGNQDTYGFELMLKKNTNNLTGWVSYTYSRSMVQVNGTFEEQKINNGIAYPSNFDRPHSFNLVSNYRISKRLSFSSNVVYSSGRPVTLPVAAYYNEGRPYLLYSSRNAYRIPDYFRIDLSVNLEGNLKFKKLAHSFWMLNVYNLTGRHNAYSVFYEIEEGEIKGSQLSVFARPIITLSWNFKFGNYNSN